MCSVHRSARCLKFPLSSVEIYGSVYLYKHGHYLSCHRGFFLYPVYHPILLLWGILNGARCLYIDNKSAALFSLPHTLPQPSLPPPSPPPKKKMETNKSATLSSSHFLMPSSGILKLLKTPEW